MCKSFSNGPWLWLPLHSCAGWMKANLGPVSCDPRKHIFPGGGAVWEIVFPFSSTHYTRV